MIRVPLLDARGLSGDRVPADGVDPEEVGDGDDEACEVRFGAGSGSSTLSEMGEAHAPIRRQTSTARHLMTPSVRHEVRCGEGLSAEAGSRAFP
jgi:hypothetical protein